jgi:hypothetical protein
MCSRKGAGGLFGSAVGVAARPGCPLQKCDRPHAIALPASPWADPVNGLALCERIRSGARGGALINRRPSCVRGGGGCEVPPSWVGTMSSDQ